MYTTNGREAQRILHKVLISNRPTVKNISQQLTKAVMRREAEKSLSVKKQTVFSGVINVTEVKLDTGTLFLFSVAHRVIPVGKVYVLLFTVVITIWPSCTSPTPSQHLLVLTSPPYWQVNCDATLQCIYCMPSLAFINTALKCDQVWASTKQVSGLGSPRHPSTSSQQLLCMCSAWNQCKIHTF